MANEAKKSKEVRDEVLAGRDELEDVRASDNAELPAADEFVDSEKTIPAERVVPSLSNLTPHGMPSDVHQVMVGLAQVTDVHKATVHEEIVQLLDKYHDGEGLSAEVRAHLEKARAELAPAAKLHLRTKVLLEKHV